MYGGVWGSRNVPIRRATPRRRKAQGNARDWGLGEGSPNMDLVFEDKFCTREQGIKCFT
ncbi:MAG: hypothetical protein AAFR62_10290 [Cyanobacteria bacterium J06629_2]